MSQQLSGKINFKKKEIEHELRVLISKRNSIVGKIANIYNINKWSKKTLENAFIYLNYLGENEFKIYKKPYYDLDKTKKLLASERLKYIVKDKNDL